MTTEINQSVESTTVFVERPIVDLSKYEQSGFERGRAGWFVFLWWMVQSIAFPLSLHNFNFLRCSLLRLFGAKIGKKVIIRPTARFTYPWKVEIGDYSWIGDNVVFYSIDRIHIGSHSVVSQKCYLCTASHDFTDEAFGLITAPLKIGNGVWIATDCFVAPGVTIGDNAVIGARSTVFKDIPSRAVAWGSPCLPRYKREMKKSVT
ncbi:MAG: hormogonium polysaccharide biosynthesis acetyltransferase HpsU [Xenococcaceae cyanobacterium]